MSAVFGLESNAARSCLQRRIAGGRYQAYNIAYLFGKEDWVTKLKSGSLDEEYRWAYHTPVNIFIGHNIQALVRYIDSTELLEIAAATENDTVLPFLKSLLGLEPDQLISLQDIRNDFLGQAPPWIELPPQTAREITDLLDKSF
ncbi:hypothetical protein E8E13_006171 [Curvularia kusanoi]|uniref:Uncharacterized protein n=1 Tax=Curvularia kusanoi TaxID=90978 RepID=A0A9P4W8K3_CURKU|nr:hypothetical protein E8E13_006171 [Curvularia kusanoi]